MQSTDWQRLLKGCDVEEVSPSAPDRAPCTVGEVRATLEEAGLVDFVRGAVAEGLPLTVLVNDAHRFTDSRIFFDAVFAALDEAALAPTVRMLVAAGSHRSDAAERSEHEERVLGAWRSRVEEIAWHDAFDPDQLADIGRSRLHRWMAEQGFYLACGSLEPHYFAGVTGAHKTLTVGVMALEALTTNHAGAMEPTSGGLRLDGNPVHLGIVDTLADIEDAGGRLLVLNEVVIDGVVVACTAGHPLQSLSSALPTVRECFAASFPAPFDVVVATVEAPLNRDFYQADKGVKNTEAVIRDGGLLIVEAACAGGVGIDHFVTLLEQAATHAGVMEIVEERGYRLGDHKAVRLRALTDRRGVRLAVVSAALDPALGATIGARIFPEATAAAEWAMSELEKGSRALVVHDAGNLTLEIA